MTRHRFAVGQEVEFLPSRNDFNIPRGTYKIVRQLPAEMSDCQYRVKNARDGHERIMRESQLAAGSGPWSRAAEEKSSR
ncbi:MAG: hypothetical protein M0002_09790 [Rhodospirillales bacterium]|nr:hypothetical protein [Rhodospirillales bacterium]